MKVRDGFLRGASLLFVLPLCGAEGVQCGPWQAIGPFKDAEYGVFAREFETEFGPEKDVVARGAQLAELDRPYQSVTVVGAPDGLRRWRAHSEWSDGYFNQIPSGPPPGRNEVTYLYRTLTCTTPTEVKAYLVTLDAAKAWLNGKQILNAPIREGGGQRFLQTQMILPLATGENRLLIKVAKCFQKSGFSFAIDGMHPVHPFLKGQPVACETSAQNPRFTVYTCLLRQDATPAEGAAEAALTELKDFRFAVEPLAGFEPRVLKMQAALDQIAPTPGGEGLQVAKEIYVRALPRFDELCAPYATVIDIRTERLPRICDVEVWDAERFVRELRHVQSDPLFNLDFRQFIHVAFKVAAELGTRYQDALTANESVVGRYVTENIYKRHMLPIFNAL